MSLVDRIGRALEAGVDAAKFERAAMALLAGKYEWLSPVEGGKDIGRDGDLYRVDADRAARGRVLATTGDPLLNLKSSHRSWRKEPAFRIDELVIACSGPISGGTRKKVEAYCTANGLPLPEFYGRDWFVERLRKEPDWCEELTSVRCRLDALAADPPTSVDRAAALLGRDSDVAALRATVQAGDDVVLVGVPGVGKTRLLIDAGVGAWFVEPAARDCLAADLVALSPQVVVLDDAHLYPELLLEVVRLRAQEGLSLVLVATCWPDEHRDLAVAMSNATVLRLERLSSDTIDRIVEGLGVTAVWARQLVINQSDGRPGWAHLLCRTLVVGDGGSVVSGRALLESVMSYLRRAARSTATLDGLASVAALGYASLEDLHRLAPLIGIPAAVLVADLQSLATGGLMNYEANRWSLPDWLTRPLVAMWFFGSTPRRPWQSLVASYPERRDDLLRSLLKATQVDSSAALMRHVLDWRDGLPAVGEWDDDTFKMVGLYARASAAAASFAAKAARAAMNSPRTSVVTIWGTEIDPVGDAATEVLLACARQWLDSEAIQGLLDLAVTDQRPQHQHADHPIRALGERARRLDPDRGHSLDARAAVLDAAAEWVRVPGTSDRQWTVYCEVVHECLSPEVEGSWSTPGSFRSITLARAVVPAGALTRLSALWDSVASVVSAVDVEHLPAEAGKHLVESVEEWLRLADGQVRSDQRVDDAQRKASAEGAGRMLETIRPFAASRPGLALRLQQAIGRHGGALQSAPPALPVPRDLELLVGQHDWGDSTDDWIARRDEEIAEVVRGLAALGPAEAAARLKALTADAGLMNGLGDGAAAAAWRLGREADDPAAMVHAAIESGLAQLLQASLIEARHRRAPLDDAEVIGALDGPLRYVIIAAVTGGGPFDDLAKSVIDALGSEDGRLLSRLFAKKEADAVLEALLTHRVVEIRVEAALAFDIGTGHGPGLPAEWEPAWRTAFLDATADRAQSHTEWRLHQALGHLAVADPQLCEDWFARRLAERDAASWVHGNSDLGTVAGRLPGPSRERLARRVLADARPRWELLPFLAGTDPELARRLLSDGALRREDADFLLSGELDDSARVMIPVLAGEGVPAERIAARMGMQRQWTGNESDAIASEIAWFTSLAEESPESARVCTAAVGRLEGQRTAALEEERQERIRGW